MSNAEYSPPRFTWILRLVLFVCGAGIVTLLAMAATLEPDARGYGTHQQLGLPPCTIVELFGVRCPSCGMTTAWSHTLRLQLVQAVKSSVSGMLLAMLSLFSGPWLMVSAGRGRWTWVSPNDWVIVSVTLFVIGAIVVEWCLRLNFMPL